MTAQVLSRDLDAHVSELRAQDDGDGNGLTLSGYAAVFNTPTRIDSWEGTFDESIAPGAFKRSIKARTPILQWNHGNDPAVGQIPIGAISDLREDARGLWVEARLHDTPRVAEIRDAIASGAVSGMSFRFQVVKDSWDESGDVPARTIREVKLFEVGPVAFPAYEATLVGVRTDEFASPDGTSSERPADDSALVPEPATTDARTTDGAHQQFRHDLWVEALKPFKENV
jgi:HK97 family phage prohead protease